jgi:hypothetical protein
MIHLRERACGHGTLSLVEQAIACEYAFYSKCSLSMFARVAPSCSGPILLNWRCRPGSVIVRSSIPTMESVVRALEDKFFKFDIKFLSRQKMRLGEV